MEGIARQNEAKVDPVDITILEFSKSSSASEICASIHATVSILGTFSTQSGSKTNHKYSANFPLGGLVESTKVGTGGLEHDMLPKREWRIRSSRPG